jgi:sugar (pentulose or hexulose) kinase
MIALAFDLGGSSGKAVAGRFDGQRLHVYEIHRFRNDPVRASGRLHWDILRLLHEIKQGISPRPVTPGWGRSRVSPSTPGDATLDCSIATGS